MSGEPPTPPASNTTAHPAKSFDNLPESPPTAAGTATAEPSPAAAGRSMGAPPLSGSHATIPQPPPGHHQQGPSPENGHGAGDLSRTPSESGGGGGGGVGGAGGKATARPPPLNASHSASRNGSNGASPTVHEKPNTAPIPPGHAPNRASVPHTPGVSRPSMFPNHSHSGVAEIAEAFRILTSENSFDATQLMRVMKAHGQQPTEEEVRELIKTIDQTSDGLVRFPEFASLMTQPVELEDINEMKSAFLELDRECTGYVSTSEFLMLMATFGERSKPEECEEMVRFADPDDTGRIDYHSFLSTLAYRLQPRM